MKWFSISLMGWGVLLLLVGIVFKSLELIDLSKGLISGPIVFGVGFVLLLIHLSKKRKP